MKFRRALGGHAKASDRTPDVYARARMAEPIRVLEEVLAWVRHGALDPDMGRLGRWTVHPSKVKEDALTRLTQEITELNERLTQKASLGELHVRKADEDLGDDASCALSSSEDEISEDECPRALEAAAGIAEAAAAVIQIPVTDELRQHPEAATALQGTEQWEGGLAPPPSLPVPPQDSVHQALPHAGYAASQPVLAVQ